MLTTLRCNPIVCIVYLIPLLIGLLTRYAYVVAFQGNYYIIHSVRNLKIVPIVNFYIPILGFSTSKDSQAQVCNVGSASGMLARLPGRDALALSS